MAGWLDVGMAGRRSRARGIGAAGGAGTIPSAVVETASRHAVNRRRGPVPATLTFALDLNREQPGERSTGGRRCGPMQRRAGRSPCAKRQRSVEHCHQRGAGEFMGFPQGPKRSDGLVGRGAIAKRTKTPERLSERRVLRRRPVFWLHLSAKGGNHQPTERRKMKDRRGTSDGRGQPLTERP